MSNPIQQDFADKLMDSARNLQKGGEAADAAAAPTASAPLPKGSETTAPKLKASAAAADAPAPAAVLSPTKPATESRLDKAAKSLHDTASAIAHGKLKTPAFSLKSMMWPFGGGGKEDDKPDASKASSAPSKGPVKATLKQEFQLYASKKLAAGAKFIAARTKAQVYGAAIAAATLLLAAGGVAAFAWLTPAQPATYTEVLLSKLPSRDSLPALTSPPPTYWERLIAFILSFTPWGAPPPGFFGVWWLTPLSIGLALAGAAAAAGGAVAIVKYRRAKAASASSAAAAAAGPAPAADTKPVLAAAASKQTAVKSKLRSTVTTTTTTTTTTVVEESAVRRWFNALCEFIAGYSQVWAKVRAFFGGFWKPSAAAAGAAAVTSPTTTPNVILKVKYMNNRPGTQATPAAAPLNLKSTVLKSAQSSNVSLCK